MNLFDEIFATIYLENVFYIITLTVRLDGRTVVGRACLRIFNYVENGISLSLCKKILIKIIFSFILQIKIIVYRVLIWLE